MVTFCRMPARRFATRAGRVAWRCLKILLAAFAGIGPVPPPPAQPRREVAELHVEAPSDHAER